MKGCVRNLTFALALFVTLMALCPFAAGAAEVEPKTAWDRSVRALVDEAVANSQKETKPFRASDYITQFLKDKGIQSEKAFGKAITKQFTDQVKTEVVTKQLATEGVPATAPFYSEFRLATGGSGPSFRWNQAETPSSTPLERE